MDTGMEPDMILAGGAVGRHNTKPNDRRGFGRYGFGLPSAAVSVMRRYHVYSKQAGGEWHKVTVDLEDIAKGVHTNKQGIVVAPEPVKVELPCLEMEYLGKRDLK